LAENPDEACLAVDFHVARLHAVRHVVELVVRDMAATDGELHVEVGRQRILPEISDPTDLGQADDGTCGLRMDDVAGNDVERIGRRLGDRTGQGQDVALEQRAGLQRRLAADRCPA
jgi:hypothetical protein